MIPQSVGTWEPKGLDVAFPHCLRSAGPLRKWGEGGDFLPLTDWRLGAETEDKRQCW